MRKPSLEECYEIRSEYFKDIMFLNFVDSAHIKQSIAVDEVKKLPENDRNILLSYAALGNTRAVGKMMGMSHVTVSKKLSSIRSEIKCRIQNRLKNAY